jgi:hypothetical protein
MLAETLIFNLQLKGNVMRGIANVNTSSRMKQLLALIILILIGILFAMTSNSKNDAEGKVKENQSTQRQGRV